MAYMTNIKSKYKTRKQQRMINSYIYSGVDRTKMARKILGSVAAVESIMTKIE